MNQLIKDNPAALAAAQAGNWSACVDALAADTSAVEDHTLRTTRWLMISLPDQAEGQPAGTTEADVILATLQAATHPRVRAAYDAMSADGIDLADPQVQHMVPMLAASGNWPAGLAEKVLAAGVQQVSKWEQATGAAPTEASVQAAWRQGLVDDLTAELATGLNESVYPAASNADRASTAAALRALADAIEAG